MPGTSRLALEAYRGDPFLGGFIKAIGGIGSRVLNAILPKPGGTAAATPAARTSPIPSLPGGGVVPVQSFAGPAAMVGPQTTAIAMRGVAALLPSTTPSRTQLAAAPNATMVFPTRMRRRRRMNPANVRALRRSITRVTAFERIASRVLHLTKRGRQVAGFKRTTRRKR